MFSMLSFAAAIVRFIGGIRADREGWKAARDAYERSHPQASVTYHSTSRRRRR